MLTMKKGEKALLIAAPQYAYGAAGSPPKIPKDATLHFEVQPSPYIDSAQRMLILDAPADLCFLAGLRFASSDGDHPCQLHESLLRPRPCTRHVVGGPGGTAAHHHRSNAVVRSRVVWHTDRRYPEF